MRDINGRTHGLCPILISGSKTKYDISDLPRDYFVRNFSCIREACEWFLESEDACSIRVLASRGDLHDKRRQE